MKNALTKNYLEVTVLLIGLCSFLFKPINSNYNRPIAGDGEGYYIHLPAIFIYQDLQYNFIPEIERKYYSEGRFKIFTETSNGKVNKYFPGTAVLLFPFFLIAHLLSYLFNFPLDGYSILYFTNMP